MDAPYDEIHVECWQCGGEGFISDCFEEYACINPWDGCDLCTERCDICEGKGGWIDNTAEDARP